MFSFQNITSIGLICLVSILTACGTLGPKFTDVEKPEKGQSRIYIYRVKRFAGSAWSPNVCINQQFVGEISNGSYIQTQIPPGKQQLSLKVMGDVSTSFFFNASADQTYFVRMDNSLPQGARESAENAQVAAMGSTGGALGGVLTGSFYGSKSEQAQILEQIDLRAQKQSQNPGFLTVNPNFALKEIMTTQLSSMPKVSKNPCEEKTNIKKP